MPAVAHFDHRDDEFLILDFVEDAIDALAHPIALLRGEFLATGANSRDTILNSPRVTFNKSNNLPKTDTSPHNCKSFLVRKNGSRNLKMNALFPTPPGAIRHQNLESSRLELCNSAGAVLLNLPARKAKRPR
jgi:hypothetical protein